MEASSRRFWKEPPDRTTTPPAAPRRRPRRRPPRPPRGRRRRSRAARPSGTEVGGTAAMSGAGSPKPPGVGRGRRVAGQPLELDRGLPLVGDRLANAEDRGHGIEEPAHPRRERRVDAEALADERPALPGHRQAGALELDARRRARAHGSPPRRLAAPRRRGGRGARTREVRAQELAAPERAVRPEAGPVEDESERRTRLAVLRQAGGGVGVVMLDAEEAGVLLLRPARGEVPGMQVVGDQAGSTSSIARYSSRSVTKAR